MRISDWSSDVCSSDLKNPAPINPPTATPPSNLRGSVTFSDSQVPISIDGPVRFAVATGCAGLPASTTTTPGIGDSACSGSSNTPLVDRYAQVSNDGLTTLAPAHWYWPTSFRLQL